MKPHEHNSQYEALPKQGSDTIPAPRFGEKYNGMYDSEAAFKEAEARYRLNTASLETNNDIIDVEAHQVVINPESPDETEDIAELIENNDVILVGSEKLVFTAQLKTLALGVMATLDQIIRTPEDELPEEIDWLPFIMSEPEYDQNYDYTLLIRLFTAQYHRERALALTRHTLDPLRFESTPLGHSAPESEVTPDEEPTSESENILKIEHEGAAPALPYKPTPGSSPGQGQTPHLTH